MFDKIINYYNFLLFFSKLNMEFYFLRKFWLWNKDSVGFVFLVGFGVGKISVVPNFFLFQ